MTTAATPTPRGHRPLSWSLSEPTFAEAWRRQSAWLLGGIALSFMVPFVFTDLMTIGRDLYYGVYVASVFTFVGLWLRFGIDSPRVLLMRNWRSGLVLGAAFIGVMVAIVLKDASTAHPHGLEFAAAIVWRGIVYGFTDGVLLSVFPILAVFGAFAGKRVLERRVGKIAIGALALTVSLLFTAVYHLGYTDFRGEKIRKPLLGDVMWSVPTLVTLSPIASPITHAGLHVGAVIHSYDTDTFLPPHLNTGTATPAGNTAFIPSSRATVKIFVTRGSVGVTCMRVVALERTVARPAVLRGAMRALMAGPTAAERGRGYGGWFSARTATSVRSVRVAGGVAYVDFRDFSRVIPNASSSCGSALLLAQLDRTATQFPTVKRAVYSFDGSRRAFYE